MYSLIAMNPDVALHMQMKPTADGDELCEILSKALSHCGIGINSLSLKKRDFTLHFATPESAYYACVSLLCNSVKKQPISLEAVPVTLVSVCGFSWSCFVCLKPESQNLAHENVMRSLGLLLASNARDRQYAVGLSLRHGEVFVDLPDAKLKEEFMNILVRKNFPVDGCRLQYLKFKKKRVRKHSVRLKDSDPEARSKKYLKYAKNKTKQFTDKFNDAVQNYDSYGT